MNNLVSIVIPTRNEEKNIGTLLQEIKSNVRTPYETVVIDDSDNGATITAALANNANKVIGGKHKGLAQAVIDGIEHSNGDAIIIMDADLQHPPEMLPSIIESLKIHDLVIMTKHMEGAKSSLSPWRKLQSNLGCFAAKILVPVSDPMTGFFGIRRECLEGVKLEAIGFKIGLEIFCKANWTSHVEIPIEFRDRTEGESKGTAHSLHKHLWKLYKSSLLHKVLLPEGSEEWNTFYEGNNWNKKWKQGIAEKLREISQELKPTETLDVGCGSSPNINYLDGKRTGIDINRKALEFVSNHSTAEFQFGNILDIPFQGESFDLVSCLEVVEHMKNGQAEKAISELARVVKPNGHVVIATPNYSSLLWKGIEKLQQILQPRSWVNDHYTKLNRKLLGDMCKEYGIKEVKYDSIIKNCDMIITYQKQG